MANCGNCGSDSPRVRSRWTDKGVQLPDECPSCAPQSFEKFKSVRDGQITMGYEYMPNMYYKRDGEYFAKDELIADTEASATKISAEDEEAYQKARQQKLAERRTAPMSPAELNDVLTRVNKQFESAKRDQATQ